jgi:alkylation response protein AidB-like acyl-CoA dehydrogenase
MDFNDTDEEAEFRDRVRRYLMLHRGEVTRPSEDAGDGPDHPNTVALRRTQQLLHQGNLVGLTWPREFGGQGLTAMHKAIVDQELARAGVARLINHVGIVVCGPTVIDYGSSDQKARYLARLLSADDIWCQLFSEPGAGSDLAGLRTSAVPDGDEWIVNGQKVWTTSARLARYGILLARTAPQLPKHKGLTMFVLDMQSPGVTVRPLRQMSGGARFNEVFFDDVRVRDEERLGEVNDGWRVAMTTLQHERLSIGADGKEVGIGTDALLELASSRLPHLSLRRQAAVRQSIGGAVMESLASRYTGYRRLSKLSNGETPGPEASAGKLAAIRAANHVADAGMQLLEDTALRGDDPVADRWWAAMTDLPGRSLAGGTDEILKNVLGERVLGLPPDPRVDKSGPFRIEA